MTDQAARFAAVYALLRAAGDVADHWVQSDFCAQVKGATNTKTVEFVHEKTEKRTVSGTAEGRRACAWHVATYTATQAAVVIVGARVLGVRLHPGALAAALTVSAATHYAADRRVPGGLLESLAEARGKTRFYKFAAHGMNGAYVLDQAWHHGWETVAAVIASRQEGDR